MAPLGWFGTVAFFGPFGIIFLILISYPRLWFSKWLERFILQKYGYKSTMGDAMIYSTIGFVIQFIIGIWIFV